ncbi:YrhB domain-containing protein [Longispora urticae]
MVSEEQARDIAQRKLDAMGSGAALTGVLEYPSCWVFNWESVAYLRSGDWRDQLVGNAPFLVDKRNGELLGTGTARSVEFYVAAHEAELARVAEERVAQSRVDDLILAGRVIQAVQLLKHQRERPLKECLAIISDRYDELRAHRPDEFTQPADEYGLGFYS